MSHQHQLRLTWRALLDLGLDVDAHHGLRAGSYEDAHEVVAAFVQRRGEDPDGQEATYLPRSSVPVYNLHAGRWRALTWHDADHRVVWLLGVGWHESGSRDDAYAVLKARDTSGELFPDARDYRALTPSARRFLAELQDAATQLHALAEGEPGNEHSIVVADLLEVSMSMVIEQVDETELQDVTVAFGVPPRVEGVLPPEWMVVATAAFLPWAPFEEIDWAPATIGGRPVDLSSEVAVRWCRVV